ncbi:hypothetical protein H4R33_005806 [Dimargaris cristalligena]|uniref:Alkylglycerone-phosphate synthase n=1 Tax=Dimargaris cristalligena TaxID=215637 RepID=A0A4Q0A066_9FUNG|nr:hypothetical protein H4R33_005806 [Dimargaris cristalligena]RKP38642.1 hypothetical protein BJ085DRAFT_39320 [Dimargaris cristalligena]|eukprot:RKP38642.1 hypothetical protein BJ085DRAFT_39320 [Dimargaris cristalligena]
MTSPITDHPRLLAWHRRHFGAALPNNGHRRHSASTHPEAFQFFAETLPFLLAQLDHHPSSYLPTSLAPLTPVAVEALHTLLPRLSDRDSDRLAFVAPAWTGTAGRQRVKWYHQWVRTLWAQPTVQHAMRSPPFRRWIQAARSTSALNPPRSSDVQGHLRTLRDAIRAEATSTTPNKLSQLPATLLPALIVWPETIQQVAGLVALAAQHQFQLVSAGYRSNISDPRTKSFDPTRPLVTVVTRLLNRISPIDEANGLVTVEAGVSCHNLADLLSERGCQVVGMDLGNYSGSVGGLIAAPYGAPPSLSQRQQLYALYSLTVATPKGVINHICQYPSLNHGPDSTWAFVGSLGTLGIITQATFRLAPRPPKRSTRTIIFPSWDRGLGFIHRLSRLALPGLAESLLLDPSETQLAQCLYSPTALDRLYSRIRGLYLSHWKGFTYGHTVVAHLRLSAPDEMALKRDETRVLGEAVKFSGYDIGPLLGDRVEELQKLRPSLREYSLQSHCVWDCLPLTVPWSETLVTAEAVRARYYRLTQPLGFRPYLAALLGSDSSSDSESGSDSEIEPEPEKPGPIQTTEKTKSPSTEPGESSGTNALPALELPTENNQLVASFQGPVDQLALWTDVSYALMELPVRYRSTMGNPRILGPGTSASLRPPAPESNLTGLLISSELTIVFQKALDPTGIFGHLDIQTDSKA